MSLPATSRRRNIEENHFIGEDPSTGFHRKVPGGICRPVPYVPAEVRRKFERWEQAKIKARAQRYAHEIARHVRQQERERKKATRDAQKRVVVDRKLLRMLFDEGVNICQLATYFKVCEATIKLYLKEHP